MSVPAVLKRAAKYTRPNWYMANGNLLVLEYRFAILKIGSLVFVLLFHPPVSKLNAGTRMISALSKLDYTSRRNRTLVQ